PSQGAVLLAQRQGGPKLELQAPAGQRLTGDLELRCIRPHVDGGDSNPSFGVRRVRGDRGEATAIPNGCECARCTAPGRVGGSIDSAASRRLEYLRRPVGVVVIDHRTGTRPDHPFATSSSSASVAASARSPGAPVPWSTSGTAWVTTSSPTDQSSTSAPTAATTPAASTPSAIGGVRPTSQSPARTMSSQLPTPAVLTAISTSRSRRVRGLGTSSAPTAPPNSSIPATRKRSP